MTIKTITKSEIPPISYEGYLWFSNRSQPDVFSDRVITGDVLNELPFVVEGLLYARNEGISLRITNIDGHYRIAKMSLTDIPGSGISEFVMDREKFGDKRALKIYQHYEEKKDPLNLDWEVLIPSWSAFVGFKH